MSYTNSSIRISPCSSPPLKINLYIFTYVHENSNFSVIYETVQPQPNECQHHDVIGMASTSMPDVDEDAVSEDKPENADKADMPEMLLDR